MNNSVHALHCRARFSGPHSGVGEFEKDSSFSAFAALLCNPEKLAQSCAELFTGPLGCCWKPD